MFYSKVIKSLVPAPFLAWRRAILNKINEKRLASETREKVFTDIYVNNVWGGANGEFCSGDGSRDEQIVDAYVRVIAKITKDHSLQHACFVDLGCGDFNVGKQLLPFCASYLGVDVVKALIENNNKVYGRENVCFHALDIVKDELPNGDVCFVRQVLQHLSNQEITSILKKLKKYRLIFITEHYPSDNSTITPNLDKVHGSGVRVTNNSGVYLTEPPFSIPKQELELVLEVPGTKLGKGDLPSVIRTYLYQPQGIGRTSCVFLRARDTAKSDKGASVK